jgi:ectoine hydroxylase-related dioxygenase (phytanoyl-CoA dioxygenase family)
MIDFYHQNGFVVVNDCLPQALINDAMSSLTELLEFVANKKFVSNTKFKNTRQALAFFHSRDINFYTSILSALWRFRPLNQLMKSESIESVVKELLDTSWLFLPGGDVVHLMCDELQIPGGYHGLGAHQDWPSVGGSSDGLVAWLALTDVTVDSYPIEVIPGSHRSGIFKGLGVLDRPWEIDIRPYSVSDFIPVECSAGDVVFFSNYLIHRSSINGSGFRMACSTRFDNGSELSYVQRGFPTAYKRVVERIKI